jgi:hypothetical protein
MANILGPIRRCERACHSWVLPVLSECVRWCSAHVVSVYGHVVSRWQHGQLHECINAERIADQVLAVLVVCEYHRRYYTVLCCV